MRQVLLYQDETGGWIAECPSLPGCNTQGDSFEEAVSNIRDAITQYVASLQADGDEVPAENFSARLVTV